MNPIRKYRIENGLTQSELAEEVNKLLPPEKPKINKTSIYRWEKGLVFIKDDVMLKALSEVMKIKLQTLKIELIRTHPEFKGRLIFYDKTLFEKIEQSN